MKEWIPYHLAVYAAGMALAFVASIAEGAGGYQRFCYYTNWSQYRPGLGRFTPDNVDPFLCTHIIWAFSTMSNGLLATYEWNDEAMYMRMMKHKVVNPQLKVLLGVGGWNMASKPFTSMAATAEGRQRFVQHALGFLRKHDFDGLDLDWEYPGQRGGVPEDKQRYILLIKELQDAMMNEVRSSGKQKLLLTAAVPAGQMYIDAGYDIPNVSRYLDYMILMAYDLHGSWDPVTGINAPLYPRSSESWYQKKLSVSWAVNYWLQMGAARHKLILGIPTYGRTFRLAKAEENWVAAPASGKGIVGKYTREAGFVSYYEICEYLRNGYQRHWQQEQMVPYAFKDQDWVGYDDSTSIAIKVQYLKAMGLAGAAVWSLDLDDFKGSCGQGAYPMTKTVRHHLAGNESVIVTPEPTQPQPHQSVTTTTVPTVKTTTAVNYPPVSSSTTQTNQIVDCTYKNFDCPGNGRFRDPNHCGYFFVCQWQGTSFATKHLQKCASAMEAFDPVRTLCVWRDELADRDVACRCQYYDYVKPPY